MGPFPFMPNTDDDDAGAVAINSIQCLDAALRHAFGYTVSTEGPKSAC